MARVKCAFCDRSFTREPRALLASRFCRHCIEDRIKKNGGTKISNKTKLVEVSPEYFEYR